MALQQIYVRSSSGAPGTVQHVRHLSTGHGAVVGEPPVAVSGDDADVQSERLGASLSDAVAAIDSAMRDLSVPATVHGSFQGTASVFQSSLASEPWLILAALLTVYIVLGILYESMIHPLTILSTLPSAGLGATLALMLCHTEFTIIALIGVILLIGIVKKNAIMMIDVALDAERTRGLTPEVAIHEACLLRFRPILMTTMAAMLGALPMALGTGVGAEMRRPLGIAVVGGPAGQSVADAVHDAGDLHRPGSAALASRIIDSGPSTVGSLGVPCHAEASSDRLKGHCGLWQSRYSPRPAPARSDRRTSHPRSSLRRPHSRRRMTRAAGPGRRRSRRTTRTAASGGSDTEIRSWMRSKRGSASPARR